MKKRISLFLAATLLIFVFVPAFAVSGSAMTIDDGCLNARAENWTFNSTLSDILPVPDTAIINTAAGVTTFSISSCRARNSVMNNTKIDISKPLTFCVSFDQISDYSATKGIYVRVAPDSTSFTNMNSSYAEDPGLDFRVYQKDANTLGVTSYRHLINTITTVAEVPGNYNQETKISINYGNYNSQTGWLISLNDTLAAFIKAGLASDYAPDVAPSITDFAAGAYLYIDPNQQGPAGVMTLSYLSGTAFDASNHTPGAAATCNAAQVCTKCGYEINPKTAHNFDDWTVTKPATATDTGTEMRECANCDVTETRVIPKISSITLNKASLELNVGESETLKATIVNPFTGYKVKFTSSNPEVASVSESGKVTALKEGTATITVQIEGTAASASCTLKVSPALSFWEKIIDFFKKLYTTIMEMFNLKLPQ